MMPRAAVVWAVFVALGVGGCGDEASSERGTSTPAATPSATSTSGDEFYSSMDRLVTRLDRAVAAALAGEANAVRRIKRRRTGRSRAVEGAPSGRRRRCSPAGNFVLTTAASARDYAIHGEREGLQLIRDVPIIEAHDALEERSERADRRARMAWCASSSSSAAAGWRGASAIRRVLERPGATRRAALSSPGAATATGCRSTARCRARCRQGWRRGWSIGSWGASAGRSRSRGRLR